jgi:hypothetical protein
MQSTYNTARYLRNIGTTYEQVVLKDIPLVEYQVHVRLQKCTECTRGYMNVPEVHEATGLGTPDNSQS